MTLGPRLRRTAGWLAVGVSTALACFWALWGIIENFHEGWFYEAWLSSVGLMIAQYLSPTLLFVGIAAISILRHRIGALLHVAMALLMTWFFSQVIYRWTASGADDERAYIVASDGQVWPRSKDFGPAYLGFRCVQDR